MHWLQHPEGRVPAGGMGKVWKNWTMLQRNIDPPCDFIVAFLHNGDFVYSQINCRYVKIETFGRRGVMMRKIEVIT